MIADKDEHIKTILSVIPEKPGCYQYFDENGTIIYVGKAKNLKRRVSSYFNKVHDSNKTRVLVKQIRDIKYIASIRKKTRYYWKTTSSNSIVPAITYY